MTTRQINKEIAFKAIEALEGKKKETLINALERNEYLTSAYVLSSCDYTVYKEGWYFKFSGTRSAFSMFVKDNDGEIEVTRKPVDSKLNKIYDGWFGCNESDFSKVA